MNKNHKISHIQFRGLMVSAIVGAGVLSMQSPLVKILGTDGWISILITGLLFIGNFAIYNQIFKIYPDKDFFEIGRITLGTFVFNVFLVLFLGYVVLSASIVARNLGDLIKSFPLQKTPIEVIIIVFIISTSYIATQEMDVIARAAYLMYPLIVIFAFLIVLLALPEADFSNLLPVFKADYKSIIKGVEESLFSFSGIELILLAIPFVEDRDKVFKSGVIGLVTVTIIYLAMFVMTLTHFSLQQIESQSYPVLALVRQLDLPGLFLENLDGVVIAFWVIVISSAMATSYFASGKVLSKLFNTKSHKYFILGLIPIIFYISLIPKNSIEVMTYTKKYYDVLAYISILALPILMLIAGYIRKRVEK